MWDDESRARIASYNFAANRYPPASHALSARARVARWLPGSAADAMRESATPATWANPVAANALSAKAVASASRAGRKLSFGVMKYLGPDDGSSGALKLRLNRLFP